MPALGLLLVPLGRGGWCGSGASIFVAFGGRVGAHEVIGGSV